MPCKKHPGMALPNALWHSSEGHTAKAATRGQTDLGSLLQALFMLADMVVQLLHAALQAVHFMLSLGKGLLQLITAQLDLHLAGPPPLRPPATLHIEPCCHCTSLSVLPRRMEESQLATSATEKMHCNSYAVNPSIKLHLERASLGDLAIQCD